MMMIKVTVQNGGNLAREKSCTGNPSTEAIQERTSGPPKTGGPLSHGYWEWKEIGVLIRAPIRIYHHSWYHRPEEREQGTA